MSRNRDQYRFRVWNEDRKEYVKDRLFLTQNGTLCYENGTAFIFRYVIELCTGKTDEHGDLIYEGDIIQFFINGEFQEEPQSVGWVESYAGECWGLVDEDGRPESFYGGLPEETEKYYRIIGNFHEGIKPEFKDRI